MKVSRFTHVLIGGLIFIFPLTTWAAFTGPQQSPPQANVPGVVWNIPATNPNAAQVSDFNITGSGSMKGDLYLSNGRALRVDSVSDSWLNMGNWKNGTFTLNIVGNLQTDDTDGAFGDITAAPSGKITASKFCIAADCITAWPSGGSGGGSVDLTPYLMKSGGTMTGALTLSGNPSTPLHAATKQYVDNLVGAAGGGTITGVTAGTGLQGGGAVGTVQLDLATAYQDGSAFDGRFVNGTGDVMTGSLQVPDLKMTNSYGTMQSGKWQSLQNNSVLEFADPGNTLKLQLMPGGASGALRIYGSGAALFDFARTDNTAKITGLTSNAGLYVLDGSGHAAVTLGSTGQTTYGVDALASFSTAYAGRFMHNSGSSIARLGGPVNAAEFTGNVCLNGDCRTTWPTTDVDFSVINQKMSITATSSGALDATGASYGGLFRNTGNTNYYAWLGYNGYGGYFSAPAGGYSVYATQNVGVGNDLLVNGNVSSTNNVLENCSWMSTPSTSVNYICPAHKIMAGMRKNMSGIVDQIYCCSL